MPDRELIIGLFLGLAFGLLIYELVWRRFAAGQMHTLEEKVRSADRELHDLRARLRLVAGRVAEGEQSHAALQDEKGSWVEQLDSARREAAELQARYVSTCDQLNVERRYLVEAREQLELLQGELKEAAQQAALVDEHRHESEALRQRLRAADTQNGELQGRFAVLLDQLIREREMHFSASRKNDALQARYQAIYSQGEHAAGREADRQAGQEELDQLKTAYADLEVRFQEALKVARQVLMVKKHNEALQQQLPATQAERPALPEPAEDVQQKSYIPSGDRLQGIRGIGRVYARRLHEAGIDSFEKLANQTPEKLREILGLNQWQGEPEEWIEQARLLVDDWDN
jgi:predicted flap endonuclease-1-like 5' DNA nuclease